MRAGEGMIKAFSLEIGTAILLECDHFHVQRPSVFIGGFQSRASRRCMVKTWNKFPRN